MKIGIFIKQVPDTETKIKLKDDKSGIIADGIKYVVNPYDEYAIEEAIKLKEKLSCEAVVVSFGPARSLDALRTALAMGADRAIHIKEDNYQHVDIFWVTKMLAKIAQDEKFDIIFMGKQAIDDDCAKTVQYVATFLGLPHVNAITKFEYLDSKVKVQREIEGGAKEVIEITIPCVVGATKGLNEPRYATLPNIMKAKKKELKELKLSDLGFDFNKLKEQGHVEIMAYNLPPVKQKGKIIQGEPQEVVGKLVELLQNEAKVL